MRPTDFQSVLEEGRALQARFPDLGLVAVGGTAAALHCHHRISIDVDQVTPWLEARFEAIEDDLSRWEGWRTHRRQRPVLILGERHGVALGLRQQRRAVPLRIESKAGLLIPTAREMLRIKAFLMVQRRATRDYVDVAALGERLGHPIALAALSFLNAVYPTPHPQTIATQFAEACEAQPVDLAAVPLDRYKGLQPPLVNWSFVAQVCQRLGRALLKQELSAALPSTVDATFAAEENP